MFCPRCATENRNEQSYCRKCGQALSGVRLALDGNAERSLERLGAGEKWLNAGSSALLAFNLIAIAIAVLGIAIQNSSLAFSAIINILLGSLIGLPMIYYGKARVKRAARLLSGSDSEPSPEKLGQPSRRDELSTSGLSSDFAKLPSPASVAEQTTYELPQIENPKR